MIKNSTSKPIENVTFEFNLGDCKGENEMEKLYFEARGFSIPLDGYNIIYFEIPTTIVSMTGCLTIINLNTN